MKSFVKRIKIKSGGNRPSGSTSPPSRRSSSKSVSSSAMSKDAAATVTAKEPVATNVARQGREQFVQKGQVTRSNDREGDEAREDAPAFAEEAAAEAPEIRDAEPTKKSPNKKKKKAEVAEEYGDEEDGRFVVLDKIDRGPSRAEAPRRVPSDVSSSSSSHRSNADASSKPREREAPLERQQQPRSLESLGSLIGGGASANPVEVPPREERSDERPSWSLGDLIGTVASLLTPEEKSSQPVPGARAAAFMQEGASRDKGLIAEMAPAAPFPRASSFPATKSEAVARAAADADRRRREEEEREIEAYREKLRSMEKNLMAESRKNCTLNEQVAKLKQDIASATEQLEADRAKAIADDKESKKKTEGLSKDVMTSMEWLEKEQVKALVDKEKKQAEIKKLKQEIEAATRHLEAKQAREAKEKEKQRAEVARLNKNIEIAAKQLEMEQAKTLLAQQGSDRKIAFLEEELKAKREVVTTMETWMEEVSFEKKAARARLMEAGEEIKGLRSKMSDVQGRYDKEASAARALKEDLKTLMTKLARARVENATSRKWEAAAVLHIQALQGHADRLAAELEESAVLQLEREAGCCGGLFWWGDCGACGDCSACREDDDSFESGTGKDKKGSLRSTSKRLTRAALDGESATSSRLVAVKVDSPTGVEAQIDAFPAV